MYENIRDMTIVEQVDRLVKALSGIQDAINQTREALLTALDRDEYSIIPCNLGGIGDELEG